ncbi:MAG: sulfatase-like hydrolase/transferase [Melioribacteraceae bacterium]|nr:sulfatase-like hydrolase/transferase [Melioribacteraceae bacterium]
MKKILVTFFLINVLISCTLKEELTQPNIIFLVSEDNSPFLGCYGDNTAVTPNLDKFAKKSVKFNKAFSNAPVCAPSRSTIITGMFATSMGTQHMRSENPAPSFVKFFPYYLKKNGYFTSNRVKKDYNTVDQDSVWDVTDWWGWKDGLAGRKKDQPFFMMYNTWMSHESKIHPNSDNWQYFQGTMQEHGVDSLTYTKWWDEAKHDPELVEIPPYHPKTKEMKKDWAKYYDCMELMDREIGVILKKLEEDNLLENSIVFYFSDHGGVLGRSKRFVFESGLKVPMLLHVPDKYKHLADFKMGSETDRVISFIDLAPTVLSLAGLKLPDYLEGKAFAGKSVQPEKEYAFGFRGRMDERYEMVRTVRDKDFRYIRNFMPHRITGGKVQYLWKAESISSWEEEYKKGNLDKVQSAFWEPKAVEELYDIKNDKHNTVNRAGNSKYKSDLIRLRGVLKEHLISTKDLGIFPETEMIRRYEDKTPYQMIRENFDYKMALETASIATEGDLDNINFLIKRLSDNESVNRYWAATGCAILKEKAVKAKSILLKLLNDESYAVKIAASEALFYLGEKDRSINTLTEIINLPKMDSEQTPDNIELYSNHFAITQALNVIDVLNIDTPEIRNVTKQISESKRNGMRSYDKRIAEDLVEKYRK